MRLTDTQYKIMNILCDGSRHTPEELHDRCLNGHGKTRNVRAHITALRKKLEPEGKYIVCELYGGKTHYRLVLLIRDND